MKKIVVLLLLTFVSFNVYCKSYKIVLQLKNSSDIKLSVSYQQGYVFDESGNNIYIGDIAPGKTETFSDVKVKAEKGETIFIIVKINGIAYKIDSYQVLSKPPNPLSFDLNKPSIKNSNSPISSQTELDKKLEKFASNEIANGSKLRARINVPLIYGLNTYCGGLVIVDMEDVNKNKEFEIGDIKYLIQSYKLKTSPAKLDPKGESIVDEFELESSTTLSTNTSFPLAGSFNFGIDKADYFKSKIELKESGWIPLVRWTLPRRGL